MIAARKGGVGRADHKLKLGEAQTAILHGEVQPQNRLRLLARPPRHGVGLVAERIHRGEGAQAGGFGDWPAAIDGIGNRAYRDPCNARRRKWWPWPGCLPVLGSIQGWELRSGQSVESTKRFDRAALKITWFVRSVNSWFCTILHATHTGAQRSCKVTSPA